MSVNTTSNDPAAIAGSILRICGAGPFTYRGERLPLELFHALRLEGIICDSNIPAVNCVIDDPGRLAEAALVVREALVTSTSAVGTIVYIGEDSDAIKLTLDSGAAQTGLFPHPLSSRMNKGITYEVPRSNITSHVPLGAFAAMRSAFTLGCLAAESVRRGDVVAVCAIDSATTEQWRGSNSGGIAYAITRSAECEGVLVFDADSGWFTSERMQVLGDDALDAVPHAAIDYIVGEPDVILRRGEDLLLRVLSDGGRMMCVSPGAGPGLGGMYLPAWLIGERAWRRTKLGYENVNFDAPDIDLLLGLKKPIGPAAHGKAFYRESMYSPLATSGYALYNFEQEWEYPSLFRSMVCMGPRLSNVPKLLELAREAEHNTTHDSPDYGAALCVQAYAALSAKDEEAAHVLLPKLAEYERTIGDISKASSHRSRWVISNAYVAGKLHLLLGQDAAPAFERCAAMDALTFSPLLGTKTIDAARLAGQIYAMRGEYNLARAAWEAGLKEAERLVKAPWLNVWGKQDCPQPYGLYELSQVLDAASYIGAWLDVLPRISEQPALAWILARRQTAGDQRQYVVELERAVRWFQGTAAAREACSEVKSLNDQLTSTRGWAYDLETAKTWLEGQLTSAKAEAQSLRSHVASLTEWSRQLEAGKSWNQSQAESERNERVKLSKIIEELQQWNTQLQEAKRWQETQTTNFQKEAQTLTNELSKLKAWAEQLQKDRAAISDHSAVVSEELNRTRNKLQVLTNEKSEAQVQVASLSERLSATLDKVVVAEKLAAKHSEELVAERSFHEQRIRELESSNAQQTSIAAEYAKKLMSRGLVARILNRKA